MANSVLAGYNWSPWFRIDDEAAKMNVPDEPGVYEVQTDSEIDRLRGTSPLITIGSAVSSLRKRLCEQRFSNPIRYLNRAEKWLVYANHSLEFRYFTAANGREARCIEAIGLMEYENEHWELPPGNEYLPISIITKEIGKRQSGPIAKVLRDLFRLHHSPANVASILGMPQPVIYNLLVYYGII